MAFNWDTVVAIIIIVGIVLMGWARVSGQTIPELIRGIVEIFQDKAEESGEQIREIVSND